MPKFWLTRVKLLAAAKYDIDEDVLEAYENLLEQCHALDYTPRRAVEVLAADIFKLETL
jgi:hypothetical protein